MIVRVAIVGAALLLGAAAHGVGERAEAARIREADDDDLLYLPEGRILRMASFGHRNFVADLVWLSTIQYYGEQRLTTRNYDQAERLFQAIYELDPYFVGATRFGALVLAQDAGNPEGAIALLNRAAADHPEAWEYPFDRGFIQQTVQKDYRSAGNSYREASLLPGAPPVATRLAGISFARLGDRDASREVWQVVLEESADNEIMARVARRNLRNLDMEDAEAALTEAVHAFREANGANPANWTELVAAGLIGEVPADPWGGQIYWDDAEDRAFATTHVDRIMAQNRDVFTNLAQEYRGQHGQFPATLKDIVDAGLARFEPWRPFGLELGYDPARGVVSWNPPWPAVEPRNQGENGA